MSRNPRRRAARRTGRQVVRYWDASDPAARADVLEMLGAADDSLVINGAASMEIGGIAFLVLDEVEWS